MVEAPELELVGQFLGDGRPLALEVADAVRRDAEHLQDVRHPAAVALRQLRPEARGLVPVLACVALLEDLRPHQLVLQVAVDIVGVLRQHTPQNPVQQGEHLPVDDPHALGGGLVAVLHLALENGHDCLHQQIADVLAGRNAVAVGQLLKLVSDTVLDSDV